MNGTGGLSFEVWAVLALVAAAMVLCMLHTLAALLRDGLAAHDLRLRVESLRHDYAERTAALAKAREHEVEIVGYATPEGVAHRRAA